MCSMNKLQDQTFESFLLDPGNEWKNIPTKKEE